MTDAAAPEKRAAPWRGKRRVADPRGRVLRVRCTDADLATVAANAARAGMTASAYIRHQITGTAGPRSVRKPHVDRVELARVLAEFGRIGSNINQLAHMANAGGIPARDELAAAAAATQDIRAMLMRALGRGD